MAQFRYTAKSMNGKTRRGTMEVPNETVLQQNLKEQGLFLIQTKNLAEAKDYRKLKTPQLASFCRELSTLLESGITLVRALDIISQQEGLTGYEREIYQAVLLDVKKGITLSEAMETKKCFPELMIGMIRSGEGTGNLDQVTRRLAMQFEKNNRLNHQVRSAMTYPMVLLVMCVAVVILIVTFILPQFQSLFDQLDELPAMTQMLVNLSDFLVTKWYLAIILVCLAGMCLRILSGIHQVRRILDYLKVHIWGFGKLCKIIYTARFARTLSSLYSSGMPLATALNIAGKTIGNSYVEEQFVQVTVQVRSGVPLSRALEQVDGLVKKLVSTIRVGEESGQLDNMLDSIANALEEEAENATKRIVTLLEPILICIMACIVGFIMVAVLMPIYQSYAAIEAAA